MKNSNKKLKLNTVEFKIDDLFDSRKIDDKEYMLPITPVIIRELKGVEYILGTNNGYLFVFGKNTTVNGYLPISGDNVENVILELVTNDKERFIDIEDYKNNKFIVIDSEVIYGIDVVESINSICEISDSTTARTILPYDEYIGKLKEYLTKAIAYDEFKNCNYQTYLDTTEKLLRFGKDNTIDMKVVSTMDSHLIARLYLLQLAFIDRCFKATTIILKVSKKVFAEDIS